MMQPVVAAGSPMASAAGKQPRVSMCRQVRLSVRPGPAPAMLVAVMLSSSLLLLLLLLLPALLDLILAP
jgi:hypothetical protein